MNYIKEKVCCKARWRVKRRHSVFYVLVKLISEMHLFL
jgi:hypothetical protein